MMYALKSLCAFLVLNNICASNLPGRAILWTPSNQEVASTPEYTSFCRDSHEVASMVEDFAATKEVLVIFCSSEPEQFYQHDDFSNSIQQADSAAIISNVFHPSNTDENSDSLCSIVRDNDRISKNGIKDVSLTDMKNVLSNPNELLSNKKLDTFVVSLKSEEFDDMSSIHQLASATNGEAVFVGLQEPSSVAPVRSAIYHRLLQNGNETEDEYLPEGTEFTIYKDGTYLYITPDIFTGLMTGLFMFFVMLIGYGCMNAIQGNDCYPNKLPTLGKEG